MQQGFYVESWNLVILHANPVDALQSRREWRFTGRQGSLVSLRECIEDGVKQTVLSELQLIDELL